MQTSGILCRIKVSGEAGDGIITAGEIVMRCAARLGYHSTSVKSFPSNIRGGYAQTAVTVSSAPVVSPVGECTILFTLSVESFLSDTDTVDRSVLVLVESEVYENAKVRRRVDEMAAAGVAVYAVPVVQLARETAGNSQIRSTVVIGVLSRVFGFEKKTVAGMLHDHFTGKGAEISELNQIVFDSGYLWARQHLDDVGSRLPKLRRRDTAEHRVVLDGNQAVALGAVAAGCSFFASYPITPATSIGEILSGLLRTAGGFAYQAEDEIAALGSVIGASFAGAKAMTATSGPGLSLMQEFIGYASMVELPVLIVDVQRAGPSTGMPTKHSQDDLFAAVYGGHGEGQRIVVAPLNVEDGFHCTVDAFNIAEQCQCPVILLSDATLAFTRATVFSVNLRAETVVRRRAPGSEARRTKSFARYASVDKRMTGYLPEPGMEGLAYCTTGIEHNDDSTPVAGPDVRSAQMKRRNEKLAAVEHSFRMSAETDYPDCDSQYDVGVCAWGFTTAATAAAVQMLRLRGVRVAALYPRLLYPLCTDALAQWVAMSSCRVVIEANFQSQYRQLVQSRFQTEIDSLTICRGEPFLPEEIVGGILRILEKRKVVR